MAALSAPGARRSLIGKAVSAAAARRRAGGRPNRLAALAVQVRQHMVTVAAFAAFDAGMFHWGTGVGLIGVCVSLLALDFAVTG